jgi:3-oxoacyl-[acyl-carrier-protein] synthase II
LKRRVVVTGIGAVSPIGHDISSLLDGITQCKSGVREIDVFDTDGIPSKIAGLINVGADGFDADKHLPPSEQRKLDKFIIYAIAASDQAVADSALSELSDEQKSRTAVMIGSGIGGIARMHELSTILCSGERRVSPFYIPSVLANLAAGNVAIKYGITGPNYSLVSACASGTHCIGEAVRSIRDGYNDFVIAGGADAAVCLIGVAGFAAAKALSTKFNDTPEKASRPWDKQRDGFVVGEGAGVLVLETLESAQKRGVKIYGEVIGYGASCDAFHITSPLPDGKGAQAAMRNALKDAMINETEVDYLNAHGTSTQAGDVVEIKAIKAVFGDHAYKFNVSSTKSAMGHLLGAAGAVEAIVSLLAMQNDIVPATLNLDDPDDECDINLTPNVPQEKKVSCVMSNSFGFGGTNGSLIMRKL